MTGHYEFDVVAKRWRFWPSWMPFGQVVVVCATTEPKTWREIHNIISELEDGGNPVLDCRRVDK